MIDSLGDRYARIYEEFDNLVHSGLEDYQILEVMARPNEIPDPDPVLDIVRKVYNSFKPTGNVVFRLVHGGPSLTPLPLDFELRPGESAQRLMGGLTLTTRDLAMTTKQFGEVPQMALEAETSKIVILGNGLSPIPLDLAQRFTLGSLAHPPVVVDRVNYPNFLTDLHTLADLLASEGCGGLIEGVSIFNVVGDLVKAQEKGSLRLIEYVVGTGNPPEEIRNAGLAVNIYGPNSRSIGEQLSLLRPGGRLLTTSFPKGLNDTIPGFTFNPLNDYLAQFVRDR